MTAGSCEVRTRGSTIRLCEPRISTDPERRLVPAPVRVVLPMLDVRDFLTMLAAPVP